MILSCDGFSVYRIGPKIGIDFRKARCVDSKCYSVLCASDKTRGAVIGLRLFAQKQTGVKFSSLE
ncbi:hypothetical protein BMW22_20360 [Rhizobium leguminosarum]|uniref:Uncharacterized protein n=1 Tax=Rhizobium leguminosarum TaxID=384 RepID=A0A1L3ZDI3_RHILE|nr:hypothetical protein BMW22_20360 [Rhizobium leguminosarum]NKK66004.1 hypothetical protein [Rhizobium leguminosarum bv. viciae]NKL08026.1 hypothetical protein [Rhizobium leguminosarum bv. viciae]NKL88222.1 hypothetical protein [Rhizobium leguminosarum bv. viciae]NKL90403.1 hypothetical protein [Rhizobium leguminosarum bv. viciae]